jgi:hypothetical protein
MFKKDDCWRTLNFKHNLCFKCSFSNISSNLPTHMTMNVKILRAVWRSYTLHARHKSILEKGSVYLYLLTCLFLCVYIHLHTRLGHFIFPLYSGLNFPSFFTTMACKKYVYCTSLCAWFLILAGWELACVQQIQMCSSSTNFTCGSMQGWLSG